MENQEHGPDSGDLIKKVAEAKAQITRLDGVVRSMYAKAIATDMLLMQLAGALLPAFEEAPKAAIFAEMRKLPWDAPPAAMDDFAAELWADVSVTARANFERAISILESLPTFGQENP